MSIDAVLDYLKEPPIHEVVRFWDQARAGRRFPAWRDIDPVALAPHLAVLWAWRWDRDLQTFIGRLAGEAILDAMGPGFRGARIEEYFAGRNADVFIERYRRVLNQPAIMANRGFVFQLVGGQGRGERVALPLADDGRTPDGLFGATIYRLAGQKRVARERVTVTEATETVEFFPV